MASETAPQSNAPLLPAVAPGLLPAAAPGAASPGWLSTVTYRSRTVSPMSELDLYRLLRSAQVRNRLEGVTGMMVYDCGWIFQQLEGPAAGLARIWDSIRRDARHGSIEVLGDDRARDRKFADWDLKLSVHGASAGHAVRDASQPPPELIERLYRGEQQAHLLPAGWLESVRPPGPDDGMPTAAQTLLLTRTTLSSLLRSVAIPKLLGAHPPSGTAASWAQTMSLARLLIAPDKDAAFALVKAAHARNGSLASLAVHVVEPAARGLGDLWLSDDCSEIEVTLGLVRLQSFVRELEAESPRAPATRHPAVLVVPQPGEAHMLGAALDAELLWRAGWNPRVEFPASMGALDALVAGTWVDALDLSMSTAFRREHRLGQLSETIAHVRLASLNPDLVVVVSGRAFSADRDDADGGPHAAPQHDDVAGVGADASFGSSSQAESTLRQVLHMPASKERPGG